MKAFIKRLALSLIVVGAGACSVDSAKSRFLLAERLWTDGKYAAAVTEFEKAAAKDPGGKLGAQALYRAAMTQSLYLAQYEDAIRKFKAFIELARNPQASWEGQKQIGEILYSKLERYDQAVQHYSTMLKQNPNAPEAPEFTYRIARGRFFLWEFDSALDTYRQIKSKFPGTPWAEKASLEIGLTYFTRGEQVPGRQETAKTNNYQQAIQAYKAFLAEYPQSKWVPDAKFGIASCLEEMDQLDAAYQQYEALKSTYPSPQVIDIKLARIRERKIQQGR